jgi:hypothetical protein
VDLREDSDSSSFVLEREVVFVVFYQPDRKTNGFRHTSAAGLRHFIAGM